LGTGRPYYNAVCLILCSACGAGLLSKAPGTWGTLVGVIIHVFIATFASNDVYKPLLFLVFLFFFIFGYLLVPWAKRYWQEEDPKHFVLDEVAGYLFVPVMLPSPDNLWFVVLSSFLLFRVFDITKTPPARYIDKNMKGGFGIFADDVVSGFYTAVCIRVVMMLELL